MWEGKVLIAAGSNVCGITKEKTCLWAQEPSWGRESPLQPLAVLLAGSGANLLVADPNIALPWMLRTQGMDFEATWALLPHTFGGPKSKSLFNQ